MIILQTVPSIRTPCESEVSDEALHNNSVREEQQSAGKDEIEIQDLTINKAAHVVKKNGKEVALTPIEFDILYLLASNRDRVFSTDEIFEKVWNEKVYEVNNTVMVHIRRLREKIEDNS